jgi:DNA polymerase I
MNDTKKRLLLVDAPSYFYRAFHAIRELRSPAGEPTNAIYGVVNMLRKLKQDFPSDYIACVLDPKGKTFRDDIYPEYKATRQAMPEDLARQIEPLLETIAALGWPIVVVDGVEADDVIGTLVRHAERHGWSSVISTGDKDLTQLVNDHVTWVNTMAVPIEQLDAAGVKAKFGVPPDRIIDYLALMGDAVDNVPGVDKVGPKTACKLIEQYGSLEGVIAHADEVKGVVGENLRRVKDWLPTGRRLLTVKTDVALPFEMESLLDKGPDNEKLVALYSRFGFRTLRDALANKEDAPEGGASPSPGKGTGRNFALLTAVEQPVDNVTPFVATRNYETIIDEAALDRWVAKLDAAPIACFDTETTSLDPMLAELVGIAFSAAPGEAAYIPLTHRYAGVPAQLPVQKVLDRLRPWLEDASKIKVGQNAKYDRQVFGNYGITVRGAMHDTLLQSYVLESHQRHDMDALATRYLGASGLLQYADVAGKGASQIPFDQVDIQRATDYSAEDADVTLQLHGALYPRVARDAKLNRIYADIEIPVSSVLLAMERNGVLIDAQLLSRQGNELGQKMLDLERKAHELGGGPFNLGSPKQLCDVLFNRLKLKTIKKTPSGAPSVDEEVLERLAQDHPICATLLEHRGVAKLKSTYTDKLPRMVHPKTGRVHTNYAQAVAVTGRLSSTDPNLQNIPVRTAEGRRIRGLEDRLRGLLADRAAHHGAPLGRRGTAGGFLEGPGHPPAHGGGSVRRGAGRGDERAAPLCQGDQLRPHLRHERLRPRAEPRHRPHLRPELHGQVLHPLPGRGALHGAHAHRGARAGLRGDGVRTAPVAARHPLVQHGAPSGRRAPGDQRADAGHGGGPDQARDGGGAGLDRAGAARDQARHAGPRRAGAGSARKGAGCGKAFRREADDGCREARRAAGGRRGRGRELGEGALKEGR